MKTLLQWQKADQYLPGLGARAEEGLHRSTRKFSDGNRIHSLS